MIFLLKVHSIDCYVCTSINGTNSQCEDPFFRHRSVNLQKNCLTGTLNESGIQKATHCLKLTAQSLFYFNQKYKIFQNAIILKAMEKHT